MFHREDIQKFEDIISKISDSKELDVLGIPFNYLYCNINELAGVSTADINCINKILNKKFDTVYSPVGDSAVTVDLAMQMLESYGLKDVKPASSDFSILEEISENSITNDSSVTDEHAFEEIVNCH